MVGTRGGVAGVGVASGVVGERKIVIVHAPIPRLQTVVKTAEAWDKLKNHANVTRLDVQVKLLWAKVEKKTPN